MLALDCGGSSPLTTRSERFASRSRQAVHELATRTQDHRYPSDCNLDRAQCISRFVIPIAGPRANQVRRACAYGANGEIHKLPEVRGRRDPRGARQRGTRSSVAFASARSDPLRSRQLPNGGWHVIRYRPRRTWPTSLDAIGWAHRCTDSAGERSLEQHTRLDGPVRRAPCHDFRLHAWRDSFRRRRRPANALDPDRHEL